MYFRTKVQTPSLSVRFSIIIMLHSLRLRPTVPWVPFRDRVLVSPTSNRWNPSTVNSIECVLLIRNLFSRGSSCRSRSRVPGVSLTVHRIVPTSLWHSSCLFSYLRPLHRVYLEFLNLIFQVSLLKFNRELPLPLGTFYKLDLPLYLNIKPTSILDYVFVKLIISDSLDSIDTL